PDQHKGPAGIFRPLLLHSHCSFGELSPGVGHLHQDGAMTFASSLLGQTFALCSELLVFSFCRFHAEQNSQAKPVVPNAWPDCRMEPASQGVRHVVDQTRNAKPISRVRPSRILCPKSHIRWRGNDYDYTSWSRP